MFKVLVVDDDSSLRLSVKSALSETGYLDIDEAFDGVNAVEKVKNNEYGMVLLDVDMPRMSGLEALKEIKAHDPSVIVIIMTAFATIDDAVKAVKEGAYNYLSKPIKSEALTELIQQAIDAQSLISDIAVSAPVLMDNGRKIIGNTLEMKKVFNIINRLSKVDTPVLVRGASGTGKELIARAIHSNSSHKSGHFVAINCSAIPENLFESELFGHEKGSFTGAEQRKIGKFQYAEGGTLFLDELGDLPLMAQVKLLRVLQEKTFTPVGSNREIEANVRIIAATNRPLEAMIKNNEFREDLYYRLNVMPIFLPSLNERKDDLKNMIQHFIKKFNDRQNRKILSIAPDALQLLKKYDWPGNIRELENVIEHAFILEETSSIQIKSLPEKILSELGVELSQAPISPKAQDLSISEPQQEEKDDESGLFNLDQIAEDALDFSRQKEMFEKEFIIKALKTFKGRVNQTALHANIPKKTLLRKMEKYSINAKDYTDSN